MQKIIFLLSCVIFIGCSSEISEDTFSGEENNVELSVKEKKRLKMKANLVRTKQATIFSFKFGEPLDKGMKVYALNYDVDGNVTDSTAFELNGKVNVKESFQYNTENKVVERTLTDSIGKVLQVLSRKFNEEGEETAFEAKNGEGVVYYRQNWSYNEKNEVSRVAEYDSTGVIRNAIEYTYVNGLVAEMIEKDERGIVKIKYVHTYAADSTKTSTAIYDAQGVLQQKMLFTKYTSNKDVMAGEIYSAHDTLLTKFTIAYDSVFNEVRYLEYNQFGNIVNRAESEYDAANNKVKYSVYGPSGELRGMDESKYNAEGDLIEFKVTNKSSEQLKRTTTTYMDKGLIQETTIFNRINEPIYRLEFTYGYY